MNKEIDPVKKLAIEQALEFAANRSKVDLSIEDFKLLIETLIKFYNG